MRLTRQQKVNRRIYDVLGQMASQGGIYSDNLCGLMEELSKAIREAEKTGDHAYGGKEKP